MLPTAPSLWTSAYRSQATDIHEIIPASLYMSDVFTAENQDMLRAHKITHIVTVSGGIKPKYPHLYEFAQIYEYMVIEIDDNSGENIKKHFKRAVEFIHNALYEGEGADKN